ncbi:unnamed protein product [Orchesella dallaii]|uniref:Uncharacterized protein n=1 Tax=Orchesella dallaii TaxID=48710 RepID=A0ABP1S3E1_9HEXA
MDPGVLIIVFIFLFAFLSFLVGVYCHFCGETGSGGRYYGSNQNIVAATALYTKRAAHAGDTTENNHCRCSNKFKGRCNSCEGDNFVDDGELGSPKDFSNFGGDSGFDYPGRGANAGDPMRGFLGNGSAPTGTSALDQPDHNVNVGSYGTTSDQY